MASELLVATTFLFVSAVIREPDGALEKIKVEGKVVPNFRYIFYEGVEQRDNRIEK